MYQAINPLFAVDYDKATERYLTIVQSHGGWSRQARKITAGEQPADVVTLGLSSDIDALSRRGLIAPDWADRLPHHLLPYTSTIVFVVRQGNPRGIKDWPELLSTGVEIVTPDPRTSGNGRLAALAAWAAVTTRGGSETDATAYLHALYQHAAALDEGARGAAIRFATREIGDVHLTRENEALREAAEAHGGCRSDLNEGVAEISPSRRMFLSQQRLEPWLRIRAEDLGAHLNYNTELVAFEQNDQAVSAIVRDLTTGRERTGRAAYMIAADGNLSPVREQLGIGMSGPGHLSDSVTIYFNADLRLYQRGHNLGVIYVSNADLRGFFRLEKAATSGFLVVSTFGDTSLPGARDVASGITRETCIALLRSAIGVPDLAVEIVDVAAWKAVAHTADRYGTGRVFRAGDAAHVMPPAGGFGGNTGVHDAHNLAWKLAAVLRGHAAPALLDSYESERRPVGVLTVGQAYTRWVRRVDPDLGVAGAPPVVEDMTMEIGYLYDAGGLYADPRQYPVPVGARAPHLPCCRMG